METMAELHGAAIVPQAGMKAAPTTQPNLIMIKPQPPAERTGGLRIKPVSRMLVAFKPNLNRTPGRRAHTHACRRARNLQRTVTQEVGDAKAEYCFRTHAQPEG